MIMLFFGNPFCLLDNLSYLCELIRLHLHRGTWQLVSADDYGWMLKLFSDKAERVIRGWMKANKVTIEDDELYAV